MRILFLADVLFPDTTGGAGRVAYHLSRELAKRGHVVDVITRNPARMLPSRENLDANLTIHRFLLPQRESFAVPLSEIKSSVLLARELGLEVDFDVVCVHQSLVAIAPLLCTSLRNIPLVYFFHSPWHEEFLIKQEMHGGKATSGATAVAFLMKWAERRLVLKASRVFVLSNYMGMKAVGTHGCVEDRVKKIPGGVDLNRFLLSEVGKEPVKRGLAIPLDKVIFLTVRNLVPRMGIENLLEAFNHSSALRNTGLLLIGGEGFLKESLLAMVQKYNLENSIKVLGRISESDLTRHYQAADFFVLPTRALEGFGLVILEAMACGTPVLGTPMGAIPEVIGPFDRNLLFEGSEWPHLKSKLEDVVRRPSQYRFTPETCRSYVEKNFSWEKMADAFEREIRMLCRA